MEMKKNWFKTRLLQTAIVKVFFKFFEFFFFLFKKCRYEFQFTWITDAQCKVLEPLYLRRSVSALFVVANNFLKKNNHTVVWIGHLYSNEATGRDKLGREKMCINTSVSNLDTHESALKKDSWIWIYSPFFVRLIKNYAICCSRQILMTARVLNVSVAIFGLPNTIFICSIRKLTGIFHLSCVGARVKTGLFTYDYALKGTPPTPR